ncbi:MAG: hypothetical protein KDM64_15335, partial [Verrucomicrobiae bacterium]|nr:hypothetical protein [Verrucomicrobiae bacterium]
MAVFWVEGFANCRSSPGNPGLEVLPASPSQSGAWAATYGFTASPSEAIFGTLWIAMTAFRPHFLLAGCCLALSGPLCAADAVQSPTLRAGAAKIDITDPNTKPFSDPL